MKVGSWLMGRHLRKMPPRTVGRHLTDRAAPELAAAPKYVANGAAFEAFLQGFAALLITTK